VRSTCSAKTAGSVGSRDETVNPVEFPSLAGSSKKILAAVFLKTQSENRTERPKSGSYGASAIDCWWDWRKALDLNVLLLALASLILVDSRSWISSFCQK
jgi:hypothetical protein